MKTKAKLLMVIKKRQNNLNIQHKKKSKKIKKYWANDFVIRNKISDLESVTPFINPKLMPPLM